MREKINQIPEYETAGCPPARLEIEIEPTDALAWLSAQSADRKLYWRDRECQFEIAGVGAADIVRSDTTEDFQRLFASTEQKLKANPAGCLYFGGFRFSKCSASREADPDWETYGAGGFVLPRFELVRCEGQARLACNVTALDCTATRKEEIQRQLASVVFPSPETNISLPPILHRTDIPDQQDWARNVQHALESVESHRIEKIVLARKSSFTLASNPDPWLLLKRLWDNSVNCYLFGIQPDRGTAFIGASPEQLYRRTGRSVESEAMAGTRARRACEQEDSQLEQELLQSEKDRREHRFVTDYVRRTMQPFCRDLEWDDQVTVRKLARVQHLYCHFQGTLDDDTGDPDLLAALHPTPAVGGYPRDRALEEIARLELFDRGWYAGPVGWVGSNAAEFAVAIRSALIRENRLILYSGAGIVEGSDPESEWKETENKISSYIEVLTSS